MGRVLAAGISIIFVVGVIVGIVVTVSRGSGNTSHQSNGGLSTGMKAVETLCDPTDYKETCLNTLSPIAKRNNSVTLKDLVKATFQAAQEEVTKAWGKSGALGKNTTTSFDKMLLDGCSELLLYATHRLQAATSAVEHSNFDTMSDHVDDLKTWSSAVIALKTTCLDDLLEKPELQKTMQDELMNATQITFNALVIVDEISQILGKVDSTEFPVKINQNSRRLLNAEVDKDGYPAWFSAADRRLLAFKKTHLTPNVVVAKDGSGQFKTISEAISAYPKNNEGRFIIYVKAGQYHEKVTIPETAINIFIYGDGPSETVVIASDNKKINNTQTWRTATFSVVGDGFIASSMGFENVAGPEGEQAVAFHSKSDFSALYNCRMQGYQDTLYYHTCRQFYKNCEISGTVDFIFGEGRALIQDSHIILREPNPNQKNTITADGRSNDNMPTGLVIQHCNISAEAEFFPNGLKIPSYLGRPWKNASRTIIMESKIDAMIVAQGWLSWNETTHENEIYCDYKEYANRGTGADTSNRVKWPGFRVLTVREDAENYTVGPFLRAKQWLRNTGVPFHLGLYHKH